MCTCGQQLFTLLLKLSARLVDHSRHDSLPDIDGHSEAPATDIDMVDPVNVTRKDSCPGPSVTAAPPRSVPPPALGARVPGLGLRSWEVHSFGVRNQVLRPAPELRDPGVGTRGPGFERCLQPVGKRRVLELPPDPPRPVTASKYD